MNWQKLDRTETAKIIQRVSNTQDGVLFSVGTSEATAAPRALLPGLHDGAPDQLCDPAFLHARLPVGMGRHFICWTVRQYPLQKIAARGALHLNERNIVEYVDFFFRHVTTEEGDIYLIRNPDEMPFMDSLSLDQQIQIRRAHTDIGVAYNRSDDSFMIQADLYFAGVLLKATLTVQADGQIEVTNHAMLMAESGGTNANTGMR